MNVARLIFREILFRPWHFLLAVASVSVAMACVTGARQMLRQHDARTEQIIAAKEAETKARLVKLEDDYRKITKGLGFNVLILPKTQSLNDLFAQDFATQYMPEDYVDRLAKSRVATIQHLLPSLQQKLKWPEYERTIILMGVRGEVPILQADAKAPILEPVPPGTLVAGWELHRSLKLRAGDTVKLLGREFKVGKLHPERGTKDDITVWISLKEAQELLDKKGLINGILALECVCASDSLDKVRGEIGKILPDTQTIEFQSQTLARAEARRRAAAEAQAAIQQEKQNRARLRQERESFAAFLVPLAALGAAAWIAFLAWGNVRERIAEIGLLRALGVGSGRILAIFLGRALLIGLAGGCLGCLAGGLIASSWPDGQALAAHNLPWWNARTFLLAVAAAAGLSVLASWLPSLRAAMQDPAKVLRQG